MGVWSEYVECVEWVCGVSMWMCGVSMWSVWSEYVECVE